MKRAKKSSKSANPLFEKWLEEWRDEFAFQKKDVMKNCMTKALNSLKKCPLTMPTGQSCMVLKYFGPNVCDMLDKRLQQHRENNPDDNFDDFPLEKQKKAPNKKANKTNALHVNNDNLLLLSSDDDEVSGSSAPKKQKKTPTKRAEKTYIPNPGSAAYALLTTLHFKSQEEDYVGYVTAKELKSEAQPLCDTSFTKKVPNSFYNAWSAMGNLKKRGYIIDWGRPIKYKLSDSGKELAKALLKGATQAKKASPANCSESSSDDLEDDLQSLMPKPHALSNFALNNYNNTENIPSSSKNSVSGFKLNNYEESVPSSSSTKQSFNFESDVYINEPESIPSPPMEPFFDFGFSDYGAKSYEQTSKSSNFESDVYKCQGTESSESASKPSSDFVSYDSFILEPNTFDVILLVDTNETNGKARQKDDMTLTELAKCQVQFEVRHLNLGDFLWIARCRKTKKELVLPHIVERKRIDDFAQSIKDGRYRDQKFRMKNSGIKNLIYMIESYGNNQFTTINVETLFQASVNCLVRDGFIVKYTNNHGDSMNYLSRLTTLLRNVYSDKRLLSSEKEDLDSRKLGKNSEALLEFQTFNKNSSKIKNLRVKDIFFRQLTQIKGISNDKAFSITEVFPTPKLLYTALNDAGNDGENLLAPLQYGTSKRQIGPAVSKTIYQLYTQKTLN